jgi:hypothetical protein
MHALLRFRVVENPQSHSHIDAVDPLCTGDTVLTEAFMFLGVALDRILHQSDQQRTLFHEGPRVSHAYRFGHGPDGQGEQLESKRHS